MLEAPEEAKRLAKPRSNYFIQEKNLLMWLIILLTPFLIAILVAIGDKRFSVWLPSFSMYPCGQWKNLKEYQEEINGAVVTFINYEFVLCLLFFLCTFWLRNIKDEFNINTEIRAMTTVLYITDWLYITTLLTCYDSVFVVMGFIQYFLVIQCLILLYMTAFHPIIKSYKPNPIIPFPLNHDSIQQLESAMMMPVSSQMFYEFINDLGDIRGITLVALYADLRVYTNLVIDQAPAD